MHSQWLVTLVLLFAAASPARGSILAQLTLAVQSGNPGDTLWYDVTLTNTSATDQIWLNGAGSTAGSPILTIDVSPFFLNAPLDLDPLTDSGIFTAFRVVNDPAAAPGPYTGSFVSIQGGPDGGAGSDFDDLVDIPFEVDVNAPTLATPEPSTFLMAALPLLFFFIARARRRSLARIAPLLLLAVLARAAEIKTVHFPSEDNHVQLVAYLFEPRTAGPHPAIVLLHGRAGAYSSLAKGVYDAQTLSKRHKDWGAFWAERGYYALLVDSFGPRNYPAGFPVGSYKDRPPEVSEQTVRPLDAYGALRYLRAMKGVIANRIAVQGWSNGAMTVLATLSDQAPGKLPNGFVAALAEYPGCSMDAVKGEYHAYAPILMLLAADDEEVNPRICEQFATRARAAGSALESHTYPGAGHNYDDPSPKKQSIAGNRDATEDTHRRAEAFFAQYLKP